MNYIKATYNFSSKQWNFDTASVYGEFGEIQMCFADVNETVDLPLDFKFGFSLFKDNELLLSKQYPDEFAKFEMADSYPLAIERQWFVSEHSYKIYAWVRANQQNTEAEQTFTVNRPPQPYPSWTWDNGVWVAPIPKPINGPYSWNEEQQQWIPMFAPDSPYAKIQEYGSEQYSPELGRMVKALNDENHRASPLGSPGVEIKLDPSKV